MAKKSRKRAAKYSELSRARAKKRKQLRGSEVEQRDISAKETETEGLPRKEAVGVSAKGIDKGASPRTSPKKQPERKYAVLDYQYVRDDLKRIGVLTGSVIVILIILSFVLR